MLRGTRVGQAYVAVTADGSGINEEIVDAVDDAGKDIDDKGREHGDDYGEGFSEGFLSRMRSKIASRMSDAIDARGAGGDAGDDAGESFVDRMTDKLDGLGDRIRGELSDRLASNPEQVRRGIDRAFDDDFGDRIGDRLGERIVASLAEAIDRQSDSLGALLEEAVSGNGKGRRGKKDEGISGLIGRMFGEGSRNNFLNLIGKTIGNVVGLVEKGANFASTFAENMNKAGEGAGLVARLMAGFGGGGGTLLALGASLPVLVVGLGAVVVVMSALVSVASALLGIVVALASTIASGLVAALAVGAGALGALAVAAGLVTLAFTSMTNAQSKALSNAFQPLKAAATGLGQILLREMVPAFETWSKNLQVALSLASPLAQVMSGALANAGNILTASFSGPGVQLLLRILGETLPGIVVNLSKAFGGFLNGVSGVFAALLPSVLRFTEYLARTAATFSAWASSARGQNEIKDFVDRAIDSLKSLWNFLKAVGGLLAEVLFNPKGQKTGNNIFDNMASDIRKFTKYISEENRLEKWFKNAEKFAGLLGKAIRGIGRIIRALDDSATIDVLVGLANWLETGANWAKKLYGWVDKVNLEHLLNPLSPLTDLMGLLATDSERTRDAIAAWKVPDGMISGAEALNQLLLGPMGVSGNGNGIIGPVAPGLPGGVPLQDLIDSGNTALNNTYVSNGGYMPDPVKPPKFTQFEGGPVVDEWLNPYGAFADSIIKQTASLADEIRKSAREGRKALADAMTEALKGFATLITEVNEGAVDLLNSAITSTDAGGVVDSINQWIESMTDSTNAAIAASNASANAMVDAAKATRAQMVAAAESAVNSAAERLKNATSEKDAKAALIELEKAENALNLAHQKGDQLVRDALQAADELIANSTAGTEAIGRAQAILAGQAVFTYENAVNLARGLKVESATLADYAEARRWAAERLGEATQKLAEAINIRDSYAQQVGDSIRNFGSLLTAQAKSIDGVVQALSANDIVESMQERINKVKAFQDNLRLLLAQGLSDAAYKQLVDAGVENGGAYAKALVDGGQGAISEVNSLTKQFDDLGKELGLAASSQMYQAGVDAAQGLVDGLLSLSEELASAAAALGAAIGEAVKKELGIASPSRVLMAMMDDVGDGAVVGLDNQHDKVGAASARLSEQIAVSPEVAAYAASQGTSATGATSEEGVSGNAEGTQYAGKVRDVHVHTPTEDPHAVAIEVIDELTGQL